MINGKLINPSSIVIIGGSDNISKPGGKVLKNIIDNNYKGDLFVVNPKSDIVQNTKSFRSIDSLANIDLAILSIPAKFINNTVKELISKHNTKAFIVLSAGFSEVGETGEILEKELVKIVEDGKASLVGPNCMGVLTPYYSGSFGGPIPELNSKGVDFASGSGATAAFILENGIEMGLKFSSMYSVGNSAQVGVEDIVEYWDENFDENSSKSKLLYLEKIDNPQKLLKHVSSLVKKGCRVAAIKAGSSEAGSRAASSHTGALSSSDVAVDALFKKAGIIRCYSREELVYAGAIFQYQELKGKKIAIITHAGGPGVMLADALSKNGLKVPTISDKEGSELLKKLYDGSSISNPIDFLATGTADQLSDIIDFINNDLDNIDAMVVIFGSPGLFDVTNVYKVLLEKIKSSKKPIYPILPSIVTAKKEVEYFISKGGVNLPDEVFFANILGRIFNTPKLEQEASIPRSVKSLPPSLQNYKLSDNSYLSPEDAGKLLDFIKIDRVKEYLVSSKDDLNKLKEELSYPIVIKVVGPLHKTDVGGVKLNIEKENIETIFEEIMDIEDAESVLIQPMIGGLELFIGVKKEGDFGHIIFAGLGGIFIEVLKDVSKRLAPVSRDEAFSMLRELRGYKLLEGVRGQEGINIEKFVDAIIKVSNLVTIVPEIEEMDINPLIASKNSLKAVDLRIKLGN